MPIPPANLGGSQLARTIMYRINDKSIHDAFNMYRFGRKIYMPSVIEWPVGWAEHVDLGEKWTSAV
jgi:hypothetical protein